ncbi:hypothetical protein CLCR_00753 [Cladophialophora carrionii]|uniref:Uncharacterized protein n=1 Tax=Cladophialophora carrionii TaxID=86049 RepID=A0A1C1D1A3_9EURO|nr:hypothetical protein CLCR_00753 [Cladophialophora carrionii]
MSASKHPTGHPSQLEGSFSALVEYLRKSFRHQGTVSIPKDIIAPFRKPFRPTDSSLLRDLAKLLENGRPYKNIVRLDSQSFYSVVSIVLHFPYSVVQSKLLYIFMDTIRQYKNEHTLTSVLSSIHGADLTPNEVKEQGDYIGKKLCACVLRHLVSREKEAQLRWTHNSSPSWFTLVLRQEIRLWKWQNGKNLQSRRCLALTSTSPLLTTILEVDRSHFLRILVADVIRELLYNGAERVVFGPSPGLRRIVENFPLSPVGDSKWMGEVIEYFSQIYLERASVEEPERIFMVQRLESDGNKFFESPSPFAATVTRGISFLVPKAADTGMITLVSVPVTKNMSVNCIASESESSTILEIQYPRDEGDRFVNGSRSAINSLTITFCDEEAIDSFTQSIQELHDNGTPGGAPKFPRTSRKQSFAIINVSSTSGDDGHNEGRALNTMSTSEIEVSSPLRDISLRHPQNTDSATDRLSQKQTATALSHMGAGDGEDTPALRKAPDSRQLIERLRSSQEEATDLPPNAGSSSRRSHLPRSPPMVDPAEEAVTQKQPTRHSAAANGSPRGARPASPESKSKRKRHAEPASSSLSNQAKKRSKAADATTQARSNADTQTSSRKKGTLKDTMARLIGAGKDASKAGTGTAQAGLKRRANKGSTTPKGEQSQKPSKPASDAVSFDLPPTDDEDTRLVKKAKTGATKRPGKTAVRGLGEKTKSAVQVVASPKGRKKKPNSKPKPKEPGEKKSQPTAASSRARRAPKTPKYIENSDESEEDVTPGETSVEEGIEEIHNADNVEETAKDSLPISKGILRTAAEASQLEFMTHVESQLQGMVDRESTDDEAGSRDKHPLQDSANEQPTLRDQPPVQLPREMHKQTVSEKAPPVSEIIATQPVSENTPKPISAVPGDTLGKDDAPIRNPSDGRIVVAKSPYTSMLREKQTPTREKLTEQVSTQPKATPQRNTKRLSETSIPPASEKLLRKTPIVHFGPQGPANQAMQSKPARKEVTFRSAADKSYGQPQASRFDDDEHRQVTDQRAQQARPEPPDPIRQVDNAEEAIESAPGEEDSQLPPPDDAANDIHVEYADALGELSISEGKFKSPEIEKTQPQSPREADPCEKEVAEVEADVEDDPSKMKSIDTDDTSFFDKSDDQETSEYVASEPEQGFSGESPPGPECQPSRKPDATILGAETPLLDDDATSQGYQRAKEPLVSRSTIRQSIGLSAILDEEYPTAQKVINPRKLRPARQSDAVDQTSRARISSIESSSFTQISKRADITEPTKHADTWKEAQRASTAPGILSMSPRQAVSANKSSDYDVVLQYEKGRTQLPPPRPSNAASESALHIGETSAAKPGTINDSPARPGQGYSRVTATSPPSRTVRSMAPPPPPMKLPTRVSSKPGHARKSWPESHVERAVRVAEAPVKEQVKPINAGPVRVKKRLTLPLAAEEQIQGSEVPPATPASFSTRLDLHADLSTHQARNDEDWRMEYGAPRFGNGSMTLVNEEESGPEERWGIWTRSGRRQEPASGNDMSKAASPSRISRGKEHAGDRDGLVVGKVNARGSQRALLSAIVNITNDVLFRFGEEEDAIQAKVDQYAHGGRAILETLTDAWNQRLEHEHKILLEGLNAEQESLSSAACLLTEKHGGGAWREAIADDKLLGKVQKKGARLTEQIETVMQ